ncbi:MAG: endolytic transglycosylase MltG [Paludibacteraceae bacterium]
MKTKQYRLFYIIAFALILLAVGACAYVWRLEFRPAFRVAEGAQNRLYVYVGATLDDVCEQLEQAGFTDDASSFRRYMRYHDYGTRIKPGSYSITDGMTNRILAQHLVSGTQQPVKLRFNNIRLKTELASKLSKQLMLDSITIYQHLNDAEFLAKYQVTPETVLTLFIPNTYEVYWTMTVGDLFDRMQREYNHFWTDERRAKAAAVQLSPVEVAVLASIIDEETNIASDKPIIAGLYLNRLRRSIPLQACPTVRYALGDFSLTRVLAAHTQIDSPYNTYKHRGLPPGPIRMASIVGIDAVLNYRQSNYLYMCASDKMDGTHNFAASLTEHNRNRAKYQRAYAQWAKEHNVRK